MLAPAGALFSIPASQLDAKHLQSVPKTPRSRRLEGVQLRRQQARLAQEKVEKEEEIDIRTRMKFVTESRKTVAEQLRHPPSKHSGAAIVIDEPQMPESVAAAAKAYLASANTPRRDASNMMERKVQVKIGQTRLDVASGKLRLAEHVHKGSSLPAGPKPSRRRPAKVLNTMAGATQMVKAGEEREKNADERSDADEAGTSLEESPETTADGEPDPPSLRIIVSAGLALKFMRRLSGVFAVKRYTHLYENNPHALSEIVRLQRWVRFVKVKWHFFRLLKHRRIVIKALIRYALRFKQRYRHRCATIVLSFFKTCFQEAGFRMAMKIFIFRVVRTQRVMRTFLTCLRARRDALARSMGAKLNAKLWEGDPKRERTAHFICSVAPHLLLEIVRKHRRPFMKARTVYLRCLKAGDLTPAFQVLQRNAVRAFLNSANTKSGSSDPPQYAGGQLKMPTFILLSHDNLLDDMQLLLDRYERKAVQHSRSLLHAAEARRQQEAMAEAVKRGKVHEFQLAQMQSRQIEVEPADRLVEAVREMNDFNKWKRQQKGVRLQQQAREEKEERQDVLKLARLLSSQPKKIL